MVGWATTRDQSRRDDFGRMDDLDFGGASSGVLRKNRRHSSSQLDAPDQQPHEISMWHKQILRHGIRFIAVALGGRAIPGSGGTYLASRTAHLKDPANDRQTSVGGCE